MMDETGSDMVMSWTVAKAGWGDESRSTPFSVAAAITSFVRTGVVGHDHGGAARSG